MDQAGQRANQPGVDGGRADELDPEANAARRNLQMRSIASSLTPPQGSTRPADLPADAPADQRPATSVEPVEPVEPVVPPLTPAAPSIPTLPPASNVPPGPVTPTPMLPSAPPRVPTPIGAEYTAPSNAPTWYRTDQERYRSVYRRANPWYRRLARGLLALVIVGALGVGVVLGVTTVSDYLERDKLPSPGAEPVDFRQTSFLVTSAAPAPELDGTLTIDVGTRAYQFVGGVAGPQANTEVVSPDGSRVYVRVGGGGWSPADPSDPVVAELSVVIPHLIGVVDSDDVLVPNLRKGGFVDLVDQSELGPDDNAVDRYEMVIDTEQFATEYPLQWQDYVDGVVPSMVLADAVPVTMSIDASDVVVGLDDQLSNWSWQRLNYLPSSFMPLDPGAGSAGSTGG